MAHGRPPVGSQRRPQLPALTVRRPRLERRLEGPERHPVTLVCGPPGAGKTTLLASAFGGPTEQPGDHGTMWLCLDERDNEAGRLGARLRSALLPAAGRPRRRLTRAAQVKDQLDEALDQVGRSDPAATTSGDGVRFLVLDDVHEARSPMALMTLEHLVHHAPEALHVVLASRADPPIGLERLYLAGRLGEIRNADLAFTEAEAAELLRLHEVELAEDEIRALWARTEGWAAGLRLAACTLEADHDPGRFVRSATRTQAVLSDYLLRELLAHKDETVRSFLLRTSVADLLTVELAELLSGDPRSGEHLAELRGSGILLADPTTAGAYRYHGLFGELLRTHLRGQEPPLAPELHGLVARWCLDHDQPLAAGRHLQSAGDWDRLGLLLAGRWLAGTLDDGRTRPASSTAGLDRAVLREAPGLAIVAAAEACRRTNREEALVYRDTLDQLVAALDTDDRPAWQRERLVLDVVVGHAFGADPRAEQAADALEQTSATDPTAVGLRRFGGLRRAQIALDAGDWDRATHRLGEMAAESATGWIAVEAAAFLALFDAVAGRPAGVMTRVGAVQDDRRGCATPAARHAARLAAVVCLAQQGELRHALSLLTAGPPGERRGLNGEEGEGGTEPRLLRLVDRAVRACLAARSTFPVSLDGGAARHPLVELALAGLGVLEVIGADGRPVAVGGPGERAVAAARARTAEGDLVGAQAGVTAWLASDATATHPRTLVEVLVLAAAGADAREDHGAARRHLGDALDLADLRGIVAPLLDHRRAVSRLLDRHLCDLADQKATAIRLLDRMRPNQRDELVEPLTEREIEVLAHLPTLMSNAEIAEGLHVSVNTVKTHLKTLYRKLGVDGRRQAVVRGRELELI